jgi:hypothetical protein
MRWQSTHPVLPPQSMAPACRPTRSVYGADGPSGRPPGCTPARAGLRTQARGWLRWLVPAAYGVLVAGPLHGAEDLLSQMRPPKPPLGPSFWEQHGAQVWIGTVSLLIVVGLVVVWWRLIRPRRSQAAEPPHLEARRALAALQGRAEDEQLAQEVSHILRRYVHRALGLSAVELTTTELETAVRQHPLASREVADLLTSLLRDCDAVKFAPVKPPGPQGLVARASELIDQFERQQPSGAPAAAGVQQATPSSAT